jgi:hypothetical protein
MRRRSYELLFALGAIILITALYVSIARNGAPRAAGLVGHAIGTIGFLMMLSTEILYSLRKRARRHGLGRVSYWLQAHIFTGIVGTYLVLLHSAWQFHGLAAVLTLLSIVVVISGFIGRYIYTAIPRTADGTVIELENQERKIATSQSTELLDQRYRPHSRIRSAAAARRMLAVWHTIHVPLSATLFVLAFIHIGAALYFATFLR